MRNPCTPWAQLITAKYAKNKSMASTSFIWKSLLKGWKVSNVGILWHLCKKSKINIWHTNWIYKTNALRTSIKGPLSKNGQNLLFKYLIKNEEWNIDGISFDLSAGILNNIALTRNKVSKVDQISWSLKSNGLFNTKSCYNLLHTDNRITSSFK